MLQYVLLAVLINQSNPGHPERVEDLAWLLLRFEKVHQDQGGESRVREGMSGWHSKLSDDRKRQTIDEIAWLRGCFGAHGDTQATDAQLDLASQIESLTDAPEAQSAFSSLNNSYTATYEFANEATLKRIEGLRSALDELEYVLTHVSLSDAAGTRRRPCRDEEGFPTLFWAASTTTEGMFLLAGAALVRATKWCDKGRQKRETTSVLSLLFFWGWSLVETEERIPCQACQWTFHCALTASSPQRSWRTECTALPSTLAAQRRTLPASPISTGTGSTLASSCASSTTSSEACAARQSCSPCPISVSPVRSCKR